MSGLVVSSPDPRVIIAFDQQVKRSCALIAFEEACRTYLRGNEEQVFDVFPDVTTPIPRLPLFRLSASRRSTTRYAEGSRASVGRGFDEHDL